MDSLFLNRKTYRLLNYLFRTDDVPNVFVDFLLMMAQRGAVVHYHIELSSMKRQIAQNFETLFHVRHIMTFYSRNEIVFSHTYSEALLLKYRSDKMNSSESSLMICRTAFKLEADVIFR